MLCPSEVALYARAWEWDFERRRDLAVVAGWSSAHFAQYRRLPPLDKALKAFRGSGARRRKAKRRAPQSGEEQLMILRMWGAALGGNSFKEPNDVVV